MYVVRESRIVSHVKVLDVLTTAETADLLDLSESQVNRLAAAGHIATHLQAPGPRGARFFHRDEIARVAAERSLGVRHSEESA